MQLLSWSQGAIKRCSSECLPLLPADADLSWNPAVRALTNADVHSRTPQRGLELGLLKNVDASRRVVFSVQRQMHALLAVVLLRVVGAERVLC